MTYSGVKCMLEKNALSSNSPQFAADLNSSCALIIEDVNGTSSCHLIWWYCRNERDCCSASGRGTLSSLKILIVIGDCEAIAGDKWERHVNHTIINKWIISWDRARFGYPLACSLHSSHCASYKIRKGVHASHVPSLFLSLSLISSIFILPSKKNEASH